MILYLHGFTSGPQSHKAQALGARMRERGLGDLFVCPQLPASPRAAIALAESLIAQHAVTTVVGSSLGGYYATYLAETFDLKAVLVNPAVVAHLSLKDYVGLQRWLYSGEPFEFTLDHIEELRAIEVPTLSKPRRFWLLVEEGDETLDYRHAVSRYAGARSASPGMQSTGARSASPGMQSTGARSASPGMQSTGAQSASPGMQSAGARQTVLPGGDHSFTRWNDYLDPIIEFAGLA